MRSYTPARRGVHIAQLFALLLGASPALAGEATANEHGDHVHAEYLEHAAHESHPMEGMLGPYSMSREASGTSWQPESSPHAGLLFEAGGWNGAFHAMARGVYTHQGGDLGDDDVYGTNMFRLTAQRPTSGGRFGLRATLSLEPATIGKEGYPLLLQTGETADGQEPLINRQHPQDLLMELAASYSVDFADDGSLFAYFGFPGEPAVGPPSFMHRFSAMENPEAPIGHHWLDSTHVSFGVATVGLAKGDFKLDASLFNGHEPDEHRYDIETGAFRSWAIRGSWNLSTTLGLIETPNLALQASFASLDSPEQLHPGSDTDRVTASIIHNTPLEPEFGGGSWQTTLAWGRNMNRPGRAGSGGRTKRNLDAFLAESALTFYERHTVFGRLERVENDELFPDESLLHGVEFTVWKFSVGYVYDFVRVWRVVGGIGAVGSVALFHGELLKSAYGDTPLSGTFFLRLKTG